MRSEKEMFDLILNTARDDDRIRAVYMNGSRTNPEAPKDLFQDYDIVYVVRETESFLAQPDWIRIFGELLMIQEPDRLDHICGKETQFADSYSYLMLFADGNRIDLRIQTWVGFEQDGFFHEPAIILLDKDQILARTKKQVKCSYKVGHPMEGEYRSCCNDFWWCLQNVAKGIWREELPYAMKMYESVIRERLDHMVSWWIGFEYHFQVSVGKMGKYFKNYLPKERWNAYQKTYSDADYQHLWIAMDEMSKLFAELAGEVAQRAGYQYLKEEEINMKMYLRTVRILPGTAKELPPLNVGNLSKIRNN